MDAGERLREYAELVRFWSPRLNLVAPGDTGRFEDRHIKDCLRALPLVRTLPPGPAADVGSGAGLPGIPLAIAGPERAWRLIEPRAGRVAFLEEAVRALELSCEVVALRAEEAARNPRLAGSHALAIARALASPERSFTLLQPLVAAGGAGAVFVGRAAELPPQAEVWADGIAIIRQAGWTREGANSHGHRGG